MFDTAETRVIDSVGKSGSFRYSFAARSERMYGRISRTIPREALADEFSVARFVKVDQESPFLRAAMQWSTMFGVYSVYISPVCHLAETLVKALRSLCSRSEPDYGRPGPAGRGP